MQFRAVMVKALLRLRAYAPVRPAAGWGAGASAYPALRAGLGGAWPAAGETPPRIPEADPLSGEETWSLATRPLVDACATADHAAGLQSAAAEQVDAAIYALERLMADLAPVMQPSLRRTAAVQRVTFDLPRDRHAVSMRRTGPMPIRSGRDTRAA